MWISCRQGNSLKSDLKISLTQATGREPSEFFMASWNLQSREGADLTVCWETSAI